jgi:thiol-disulfide isomerase/thioredoxin
LVVVKFYAAYCQACRALEPRFLEVMNDPQIKHLPVVWAEFQLSRHTKELFRRLGVLTLPTIHFYDGSMLIDDGNNNNAVSAAAAASSSSSSSNGHLIRLGLSSNLIENFPCPPAKVKLLKKKLARFLNQRVDPVTFQLRKDTTASVGAFSSTSINEENDLDPSGMDADSMSAGSSSQLTVDTTYDTVKEGNGSSEYPSQTLFPSTSQQQSQLQPSGGDAPRQKRKIIIDNELITDDHIEYLRYGMPFFKDLTDEEFDALLQKARLLTFDVADVISKQGMPGTTFYVLKRGLVEMSIKSRFEDPIRTPPHYLGVVVGELRKGDYFGERALSTGEPLAASFRVVEKVRVFAFDAVDIPESSILSKQRRATREMIQQLDQRYILPADYKPVTSHNQYMMNESDDWILELLVRFKQIRQAAKCFNYIMMTEPKWNDPGESSHRCALFVIVYYSCLYCVFFFCNWGLETHATECSFLLLLCIFERVIHCIRWLLVIVQ